MSSKRHPGTTDDLGLRPPCYDDPEGWTEAETPTQRQKAVDGCNTCPVLAECAQYAAGMKWYGGIIIAGWVAPTHTRRTWASRGFYPPWSPLSKEARENR